MRCHSPTIAITTVMALLTQVSAHAAHIQNNCKYGNPAYIWVVNPKNPYSKSYTSVIPGHTYTLPMTKANGIDVRVSTASTPGAPCLNFQYSETDPLVWYSLSETGHNPFGGKPQIEPSNTACMAAKLGQGTTACDGASDFTLALCS